MLWEALMDTDFFTLDQAKQYLSEKLKIKIDDTFFYTYCLKNEIPIVHEALSDFSVTEGFEISEYEAVELEKYRNRLQIEKIKEEDGELINTSLFGQCDFEERKNKIISRIRKALENEAIRDEKEYYQNMTSNQMSLEEVHQRIRYLYQSIEVENEQIATQLECDEEYVELLKNKPTLDWLLKIRRSKILKIKDKYFAFNQSDQEMLPKGIYTFLDTDLSFSYSLLYEISSAKSLFSQSIDYKFNKILQIKDKYYIRHEFGSVFLDNPLKGILQDGFLQSDFDKKNKKAIPQKLTNEDENYLLIIGALLEDRKQSANGKRIQSLVAQNIDDMTRGTDAKLSKSKLEKIFAEANKVFKPFNNNNL